jgi:zinc protease
LFKIFKQNSQIAAQTINRHMKKLFLSAFMVMAVVMLKAQTPPATSNQPQLLEKVTAKPGELIIAYEKWQLPNGLILYIHEDHSDPIVHVDVTYHVGSARETPGKSGFAHFFEHMMFQGSEHVADEEHFKIVEGAGGDMNGTTNRDRTNYFETLPKNYLETALWLESDRMGFLLDSVTQAKFETQRATVKNEKDQRVTNVPYGRTDEIKDQILYPSNHPYNWPTIGYVEDLDRVGVDDLKNFFMRWYGPNNASLVVAGDVNPKEVLDMTMKYFGSIPRGPEVRKQKVEAVRLPQNVYANYGDNIVLPLMQMVYPSVPSYHPDEPALDILSSILGQGNNSIFYQEIDKKEKALSSFAYNYTSELSGEFTIAVYQYPTFAVEEVINPEDLIKKAFETFEARGATDDDIARAIGEIESQLVSSLQSIGGKASILSQWHYLLPNKSMNLDQELARYKKVTKEDVMRVYRQYLKGKFAAIVNVFPKQGNSSEQKEETKLTNSSGATSGELEYKGLSYNRAKDNFDRSKRPEIKEFETPSVPIVYNKKTTNGLSIVGTTNNEIPMVTMVLTLKGGNVIANDPKKAGLATLTALMMNQGTQKYTAEQFSSELSKLGSDISVSASNFSTTVVVTSRKENIDKTLVLLEEKLMRPKFTPEDFKLQQRQLAEEINSSKVSGGYLAQRAYATLLYGKNMMSEPSTGSIKTIKSFTTKDIQYYYDNFYSPSQATLVIVGAVSEQEIMPKLDFLSKWQGKPIVMPELKITGTPAPKQPTVYLVDKYKASQSEIRVGNVAMPYDYNGKFYRANIMNYPLGGNFNSRLNLNLRENKGFTYGVRSYFSGNKYAGNYTVSLGVRATATDSAIKEIMYEIKNYIATGIQQEELDYAKKSLGQSDALRYETQYSKAGFLSEMVNNELPSNFVDEQNKILQSLTKSDIDIMVKELIIPENMYIVVVGDKDKVTSGLQKLGYKVVEYKVEY